MSYKNYKNRMFTKYEQKDLKENYQVIAEILKELFNIKERIEVLIETLKS